MFFNRHKYEKIIKYQQIFLNKIKLLLLYFVEFYKDDTIVPKKYLNNYKVEESN